MSVIDWGDAPTWFGTGFAALAAGAAMWTLKSQRDQIDELAPIHCRAVGQPHPGTS
ncbi:hypothetical protein ACWFR5_17165 [Streptomyces sp. NPDC055092]